MYEQRAARASEVAYSGQARAQATGASVQATVIMISSATLTYASTHQVKTTNISYYHVILQNDFTLI